MYGRLESGVGFGVREHICIDEPRPVDSSKRVLSWVQRVYFCKNVSGKGDDIKHKAVVWIVDGDQLVRCSSTHLRPVSTAEQTLCSLRDGEAQTFQQVVQELLKRNFVDLAITS